MTRLVRAACLTNYVEVARATGLDPWRMLTQAGLNRTCVENPELRISVESVRQLLEASAALSGEEAFGLRMAEGRRLSNLGALGLLSREEPTLRRALASFSHFGRMHNESLQQRIEEAHGIATIHEELLLGRGGPVRQATELVVAVAMRLLRVFLGADWRARRVCFTHPEPADMAVHRRVLGQTPDFGREFTGIVCTSADLDTPIASADPVLAHYIREQLQVDVRAAAGVVEEVKQMVLVLLPKGRCTGEQVAHFMGVTRRTLYRHLLAQGQSFGSVMQEVRRELALRYVAQRQLSLTEIAPLLGFADLSTFSRWHRAQFGQSAEAARRATLARPAP